MYFSVPGRTGCKAVRGAIRLSRMWHFCEYFCVCIIFFYSSNSPCPTFQRALVWYLPPALLLLVLKKQTSDDVATGFASIR